MEKPTLPKGTRDFGPATMAKRQFILESIKKVFQKYGFQPLETPAMENLTTLTGKYGEEGDQLLFKVLNNGEFTDALRQRLELFIRGQFKKQLNEEFLKLYEAINSSIDVNETAIQIEREIDNLIRAYEDDGFGVSIIKKFFLASSCEISIGFKGLPRWNENDQFENFWNINQQTVLDQILSPKEVIKDISEKGLRYDLTVPFARYVVMNRHEITFPFKRYQIQPVWRADRPQKGRYREFYQCDADVVGTDSLICEAEIILMIKEVFASLGIQDYSVKINHRGILSGLAEICNAKEKESSLFVAIDKLDKIGEEKVKEELRLRGFEENSLTILFEILNFKGTTNQKIDFLTNRFSNSESGQKGIADFKSILSLLASYGATEEHVEFDISLARGLSYYTGCIFEVKISNVAIGSVSGGGRYDNLTGSFGLEGVSGIGISFGVDRLYDAMEELKLFPMDAQISSKVLICHFDEESKRYGLKILQMLRQNGIASEVYPDAVKIQKQLEYANKKMIPFTIVIGSEETKSGLLAFKDLRKGEQQKILADDIITLLTTNN